jgi:2-polyprenyl-6-methoxyphenol hydroxylase-like FAD-dependent oxidoreductase
MRSDHPYLPLVELRSAPSIGHGAIRLRIPTNVTAAGPLSGFSATDSYIIKPHGSLVLIGDARGISHPTWGMGMELLFRDARGISKTLTSIANTDDWPLAVATTATKRITYFEAIFTAENWMSDLMFSRRRSPLTSSPPPPLGYQSTSRDRSARPRS